MSKWSIAASWACVVLGSASVPSRAADASLGSDLSSRYIWRGINLSGGPVLQPYLDVAGLRVGPVPLGINVWANLNLDDWDGRLQSGQFSEVDLTLTAELPRGIKLGYIEYVFAIGGAGEPSRALEPSTRELFASWSHPMTVRPAAAFYYDFGSIDSGFLLVSLARDQTLTKKAAVEIQAEAGYAGESFARYYGGAKGGFYHYGVSGRLVIKLGEKGQLAGTVGFASSLDEEVLPRQDTRFFFGLGAAVAF